MTGATRYVRPFADLGRGDLADAGGKGANLGELTRAGLPVPPGFVLTTAAYRAFVAGIGEEVLRLADVPRDADPSAYDEPARRIHALFDATPVPGDIAARAAGGAGRAGAGRRRPLVGDRRGPGGGQLRRPAGHLPRRPRRRRAARRRPRLLGVAVDRARDGLPRPAGHRPRAGRAWPSSCRRWSTPTRPGCCSPPTPPPAAATRSWSRRLGTGRGGGERRGDHRRRSWSTRRPGASGRAPRRTRR